MDTDTTDTIINFLILNGTDHRGRRYVDYIAFSDKELEINHDYIQWMFPLHEGSKFNPDCPVLTPEISQKAQTSPNLKSRLGAAV
ncbi:MAG: opioid growth factor receptor-related protein, partial [Desulfobulbia bacterium]